VKLGDVGLVLSGLSPRGGLQASENGSLAIQLGDISANGEIDLRSLVRIADNGVASKHFVGQGDVLFRSRGMHTIAVAVGAVFKEPAIAVMPLFIIRPNPDIVDSKYLEWFLNQPAAQRHFDQGAAGTSLRMIRKDVLESVNLDLPPLSVQRVIAELADLASRERALSHLLADRRHERLALGLAELSRETSLPPKDGIKR